MAGWIHLLGRHPVEGAGIVDLQIVAAMLAKGVQRIYTFNPGDFQVVTELIVVTPEVWYYGIMATQKITFSLPEALVRRFARQVPPRQRSRYVAEALAWKLKERDRILARACEIANRNRQARAIEQELGALADSVMEPWDESSSR